MKTLIQVCALAVASLGLSVPALAAWPERPITLIVPAAPGGTTDITARLLSEKLGAALGTTVVVENRAGAAGIIGTQALLRAAPDGYTIGFGNIGPNAINYSLYKKLPYNPKEIIQVSLLADGPAVLVARPTLDTKTLKETIDFARANPGKLNFGSGGQGSSAHLAMEAFLMQNKAQLVHIPFKGIAAAMVDVAAGRVDIVIGSAGSTSAYIKDNRLLGLAVSGDARHPAMPNVPTFAEAGFPGYKMMYWFGMMAPAGTPPAIVERMQKEIAKAVATPKVVSVFTGAGVRPIATTSAVFTEMVQGEITLWSEVIARANITVE
ncbi:MAG: tripartite tricarboxylate transporter substrate binding protein [Burkholderiales bacterium]|nr:tripartite tricarboxylate transporter substrate binding protein [Burkholderiales bacterium]